MSESILRTRHSARSFLQDKPVDEKLIREIVEEAGLAPSWCNSQPWKAFVLTGDAAKKMVETHTQNNVSGAKAWCEVVPPELTPEHWKPEHWQNMQKFWAAGDVMEGRENRLGFLKACAADFHAPAIVYITIPKSSTFYQAYDAGAFGYGICLAAHERGLSCIPAYEFIRFPQEIRAVLDIPEDELLFMGIGIGYADDAELNSLYKTNGRVPVDEILTIKSK